MDEDHDFEPDLGDESAPEADPSESEGSSSSSDSAADSGDDEEVEVDPRVRAPFSLVMNAAQQVQECIVVSDPAQRRTSDMLSSTELAMILSTRAAQIARTGTHFGPAGKNDTECARLELDARRCPLLLRRLIGEQDGKPVYEEWTVSQMAIPSI